MEIISSIKHEKIIFARSLQQRKGRLEAGAFLVEGEQQIRWLEKSRCRLQYVLIHDKIADPPTFGEIPRFLCSEGILKKVTGTTYLVPVIGVAAHAQDMRQDEEIVVVMDGVQDFGNIGTIVRTAHGFGIHSFVSTQEDFDLFQRKTIDASRGSVFHSACENSTQAIQKLKAKGYQIVATALEGSTIQSLAKLEPKPTAIVFGNETHGVSSEVLEQADLRIQIPMATDLDSLNVGVAAGISLYELKTKVILMLLDEKIRGSFGRNLSCSSRWMRKLFDHKLKQATPLTAEAAIVLMILSCDEKGSISELIQAGGIENAQVFTELCDSGYLCQGEADQVTMTEKVRELLAKIWSIHEAAENAALTGFTEEERAQFEQFLFRIQSNLSEHIPYE